MNLKIILISRLVTRTSDCLCPLHRLYIVIICRSVYYYSHHRKTSEGKGIGTCTDGRDRKACKNVGIIELNKIVITDRFNYNATLIAFRFV